MHTVNPLLDKVLDKIKNADNIVESKGYDRCGVIYVYSIPSSGLKFEEYNGGFKVCYQGEKLFSTHSKNGCPENDAIRDAIDNKIKDRKQKTLQEFLNS